MSGNKSRGRQKINMAKIQNRTALLVTFSKRHNGLFKKASELCTLSGAEIGVIVFSPGQKVYTFGHPSIESIIERYEVQNPPAEYGDHPRMEALSSTNQRKLNEELDDAQREYDDQRKRAELLDRMAQAIQNRQWWKAPSDNPNLEQLEILKDAMEKLHQIITDEMQNKLIRLLGIDGFGNTVHSHVEPSWANDGTSFNSDFQFAAGARSSNDANWSQEFNNLYGHG